jgi:protein-L-isoaspartate O-methyltransferase
MTLDNLAKIGRLKEHVVSKEEIAELLAAARRNLDDALVVDPRCGQHSQTA